MNKTTYIILNLTLFFYSCNNNNGVEPRLASESISIMETANDSINREEIISETKIYVSSDSVIIDDYQLQYSADRTPSENPRLSIHLSIYKDTIIDLSKMDNKFNIKLKFNWLYNSDNVFGIQSIDIIKEGLEIHKMDIKSIMQIEAFSNDKGIMAREDLYLCDWNKDSYLDFVIRWVCARGCFYSYWIYSPKTEGFEYQEQLDFMRPYAIINNYIYSYTGGNSSSSSYESYRIDSNNAINKYQSLYIYTEIINKKPYTIKEFYDKDGNTIRIDSIEID
ncbi:MAG: hypothetical protein KAG64_06450 [Bacteroidales bacterium]|nr:hypothetical protein [Bacteroidales bacterium]